jgi:hypothetical protein
MRQLITRKFDESAIVHLCRNGNDAVRAISILDHDYVGLASSLRHWIH